MSKLRENNTFGNYEFDDWVCEDVRIQIMNFWGCFRRTYKDWLADANTYYHKNEPKYGQYVCVIGNDNSFFEGRYIHAWNNMGRIISKDGTYKVVSTCDTFYDKRPDLSLMSCF